MEFLDLENEGAPRQPVHSRCFVKYTDRQYPPDEIVCNPSIVSLSFEPLNTKSAPGYVPAAHGEWL
jgi:hypothetical protein